MYIMYDYPCFDIVTLTPDPKNKLFQGLTNPTAWLSG